MIRDYRMNFQVSAPNVARKSVFYAVTVLSANGQLPAYLAFCHLVEKADRQKMGLVRGE